MRTLTLPWLWTGLLTCSVLATGCGADDPSPRDPQTVDDEVVGSACEQQPAYTEDVSTCEPTETDYLPRVDASAGDTWATCISDAGAYTQIDQSVSSIARVAAYDSMASLLWAHPSAPTPEDFTAARLAFEGDGQGLGSRVSRRYDVHFDVEQDCALSGVPEAYPDYCVGPATLQPIINEAFSAGMEGRDVVVSAARIHAALQWFLYVSSIKEATTCTTTAKDCDSAWAYYTGGGQRDAPAGLAAEIDALAPETHDRAFDGVLAVRCWRDLDPETPATDLALRDLAIGQTDRALLRGMAMLVRQRFARLACASGDYAEAELQALRVVVPLLDRETRLRSATTADLLLTEINKKAAEVDVQSCIDAIDATYSCP